MQQAHPKIIFSPGGNILAVSLCRYVAAGSMYIELELERGGF
jgi:hypothetical protein